MNGLDLDDLPRRLADLADAAGPWDDPMPEIRRRAALDSATDEDPAPVHPRPAALRARNRWHWSADPFTVASVAAAVLLVVGLGWLIHSGTLAGTSSKSASDATYGRASGAAAAPDSGSSAAAAGGNAGRRPSGSVTAPVPAPVPLSQCGLPGPSSALSLTAPTTVRTGAVLSVHVRLAGLLAATVQTREILVVSGGSVVGRLVPTSSRGSGAAPTGVDVVVTGTLRTSSCGQVTPKPGPNSSSPGTALAPGRYQLVVVVTSTRAVTVSAPVAVTVTA